MLGCPTQESAIEAAIQAGREKIDVGLEGGREVGIDEPNRACCFQPDAQPDENPTYKCLQVVCSPYEPV